MRSPRFCLELKPGLGRGEPQLAPPAPDAGRGVAKRRRDRRAEVRRLLPSRAHSTNAAAHRKKAPRKIQLRREQTQTRPTTRAKSDCGISVSRFQPVWVVTGAIMMFTPAHMAKPLSPHPDEARVVGAGRDRRSRRRSGRERSAPAPISRGRSGHTPAFEGNRVAPGRSNAESGATLFPVPARGRVSGTIACRDTIPAVASHSPHWLRFLGASLDRLAREPRFRSFAASALLQN